MSKIRNIPERGLLRVGVGRRYVGATEADFPGETTATRALATARAGGSVALVGGVGCGKTHLAVACLRAAIEGSDDRAEHEDIRWPVTSVAFWYAPSLMTELNRVEFEEHASGTMMGALGNLCLLVLDDIGTEHASDWGRAMMDRLINVRYEGMGQTIVTSNLALEDLIDRIGERAVDRLGEMCKVYSLEGKSRRQSA